MKETDIRPEELMQGQKDAYRRDIERILKRKDEFVHTNCPGCDSTQKESIFEKFGLQYVRCRLCGTAYMDPRPTPSVLDEYYSTSENYEYWNRYVFPASETIRREKIFRPRAEKVVSFANRHGIGRGTLVDVGAGFGTFCEESKSTDRFDRVIALEPTPSLAETCRQRGLEVWDKPIEKLDAEAGSADVMTAFEVIEHLFQPSLFFNQCWRLLNRSGLLVLTCPNIEGFDLQLLGPVSDTIDFEHLNYFSPTSLSALAQKSGFEVLEVLTPGELDAELVHKAAEGGKVNLSGQPLLEKVLLREWTRLGVPFQRFLSENGLSSHLWLVAKKVDGQAPVALPP